MAGVRWRLVAAALVTLWGVLPADGAAQDGPKLADRCLLSLLDPVSVQLCRDAAAAVQALQPEAGMLMVGGNPVLGTASPLGTRFRFMPRLNVGLRINLVSLDLPDVIDYPDDPVLPADQLGLAVPMPQLDLSVGVFDGFELVPSMTGLAAVELLGSASFLILPGDEGFQDDATAYGIGARIGLLRESFVAPGLSLSILRKWIDRVQFGDVAGGDDAQFGTDLRVWSFRAGVSKSFLVFGLAAGLGYDDYESDVDLAIRSPSPLLPTPDGALVIISEDEPAGLESDRWSGWLNASYILLFLNFVAEIGWQERESVPLSTGDEIESGNLFGAIGIRLSL